MNHYYNEKKHKTFSRWCVHEITHLYDKIPATNIMTKVAGFFFYNFEYGFYIQNPHDIITCKDLFYISGNYKTI